MKLKTTICFGFVFLTLLMVRVKAKAQNLHINEFMASNETTLADQDNEYSDWIEIYNPTPDAISLLNWSLTDDPDNKQKWLFPDITIAANQYVIIFASGKDQNGTQLHTNFKLEASGEYLALIDPQGNVASGFDPTYAEQLTDISYSFFENEFFHSTTPSPGTANILSDEDGQLLPKPTFSHTPGFYETSFNLSLSSTLNGVDIIYTTDGSEPDALNAMIYTAPITISTTTILRAALKKSGNLIGPCSTQTYLFIEDVINQPNNPPGYPNTWGPYTAISGNAIGDYEMDPEITQDPKYASKMKEALLSIPTLSLVTKAGNLFSNENNENTGGIYYYTGAPGNNEVPVTGKGWERPASIELINPDGTKEFQVDCGVRLHGGHSRRPEKSPKHSFRIVFKDEYGPKRLNYPLFGDDAAKSFDSFVLRAGFGNTIYHWGHGERIRMQHLRDVWAKDTQLAMGHPAGHGMHVHLYINGLYWGIYNPTEYLDSEFAESYFGANTNDFDVIKDYAEVANGDGNAWNELLQAVEKDLSDEGNYQRLLGNNPDGSNNFSYTTLIDPINLADYMILNFYGGNTDWDHHNWVAMRNRLLTDKGFTFFSWDAEHVLKSLSANNLNEDNPGRPSHIFQRMLANVGFMNLFANRIQLHCFNGGALTPHSGESRWLNRSNKIEMAIIAETARWGDYRRDVHPFATEGPFQLYTYDDWIKEKSFIIDTFFPQRTNVFIQQLRSAGLFPMIDAPSLFINNNPVQENKIISGDKLSMTSTSGVIQFTLDGSDPMLGNSVAYTTPLILDKTTAISARTLVGSQWSALTEKVFFLANDYQNLKVTEIHYHPLDEENTNDDELEFIELKNTGSTPIDLSGLSFSEGIQYSFPNMAMIQPNTFIVLASNVVEFNKRYTKSAFGEYQGQLDNAGETISLSSQSEEIFSITYDDNSPWPEEADGSGNSIVPVAFNPVGDQNNASGWRASLAIHGSPGRDDELVTGLETERTVRIPKLHQNFPNPFKENTIIPYTLPSPSHVEIKVFDLIGKEVAILVNEWQGANSYGVPFHSEKLKQGIYFYQLKAGLTSDVKRMIVLK